MDAGTEELRAAHGVLSELYAVRLADALDRMPEERAHRRPRRRVRHLLAAADEMERRVNDAGFATVFWGGVPLSGREPPPRGT